MRRAAVEDTEDGLILLWGRMSLTHLRMKELNDESMPLPQSLFNLVGKL